MHFICTQCKHRQDFDGDCGGCKRDVVLDLRKRETREFLREIESRHQDKLHARIRGLCTVGAMLIVFAMWMIPGYWSFRRTSLALPLLLDQWIIMIGIGLGLTALFERLLGDRRQFPFLDEEFPEN